MNNTVLISESIYWRCHKVYNLTRNYVTEPAKMQWSWRKFKKIEVSPAVQKYCIYVNYSIFNEVKGKLENDNHTWTFKDIPMGEAAYATFVEQLKQQDPAMRYVEDALVAAVKES